MTMQVQYKQLNQALSQHNDVDLSTPTDYQIIGWTGSQWEPISHDSIHGVTGGDAHTQYALLAGRSGGQVLKGGTDAGDHLDLYSSAHGTPTGQVRIFQELNVNSKNIINVADPTADHHAVNRSYAKSLIHGLDPQESVLDQDLETPPVSPDEGDRYIIGDDDYDDVESITAATHTMIIDGDVTSHFAVDDIFKLKDVDGDLLSDQDNIGWYKVSTIDYNTTNPGKTTIVVDDTYNDFSGDETSKGNAHYASGAWSTIGPDKITEYFESAWITITPDYATACKILDEDKQYTYNTKGRWVDAGSTMSHNSTLGLQGGTTDEYYHLTSAEHTEVTTFFSATDITGAEAETLTDGSQHADTLHMHTSLYDSNDVAQAAVDTSGDLTVENILKLKGTDIWLDSDEGSGYYGKITQAALDGQRTWTFPNKDGTVAMLSDVQAEDEFIELNDTPGAYTNADHLVKQNSTPDGLDFVTNSFKMTATNVMTLTLAALGDDRAYGIPDAGDDADFMLTKASGNVALNYWLESPDADPDADLELANKRYVDRRTVWAEEEIASAVGDETGMTLDYTPFANSFMLFFNGQRLKQVGSSPGQGEFTRTGTTVAWDAQYIDAGYYVVASYMYQAS